MRDENGEGLNARASQLVELARKELGQMSARRRAEGLVLLNARRAPRRGRQRLLLGLAAVLAAVALVVVVVGRHSLGLHRAEVLSYGVEGGQVDATGNIAAATATAQPALRFSDGTEVVFLAGARGRVRSVSEHGARIALTGKVKVGVVPWPGSRWLFDAGPFLITVKGTAFTADWQDAEGQLEVVLETGTVAVSGPLADEAITLRSGQRLVISTRRKEVLILNVGTTTATTAVAPASASPPPSSSDGFANAPSSETRQPLAERSAQPSAPAPSAAAPNQAASDWTAALAAGDFATILREAEQRGLEASLAQVSSSELAALADAARYSRREGVARRALAAQRRRFPQSVRANDAAYLLGRLEETAQHAELALTWYERCLTESPQGAYVSEALGRKMTIVQRLHGATQARPVAAEYLRRFGNGTYAAAARALTSAP